MITVFRYRTMKPEDGQVEFTFHREGTIIGFVENWHTEKGWETVIDVLVDNSLPVEKRQFFLCTAGDNLDALGEQAFAYHVATHTSKSYVSYLFDISHLPDQLRAQLRADRGRLRRDRPDRSDMGRAARLADEKRVADAQRARRPGHVNVAPARPAEPAQPAEPAKPAEPAAPATNGDTEVAPDDPGQLLVDELPEKKRPRWSIRG